MNESNRNTNKKRAVIIASTVSIFVLLVILLFVPKYSYPDIQLKAVRFTSGEDTFDILSVHIKGEYIDNKFKTDTFEGTFAVEGYTDSNAKFREFPINPSDGASFMAYQNNNDATPLKTFGIIYSADNFESFVIRVFDGEKETYICYPSAAREDAVFLANNMIGKYYDTANYNIR